MTSMNEEERHGERADDDTVARLFGAVARDAELPDAMRERWRARFGAELRRAARSRRRRRLALAGLALAAGVAALLVFLPAPPERPAPASARVQARIEQLAGEVRGSVPGEAARRLRAGDAVVEGELIEVAPQGGLALQLPGLRLRADGGTRLRVAAAQLELLGGQVYAEDAITPALPGPAPVLRAAGIEIRHTGTQYLLSLRGSVVRAVVRDGAILLRAGGRTLRAEALATHARQVEIGADREMILTEVPTHGQDWQWIHALAPEFAVDGVTADAFLRWASKESGFTLRYDSEAARRRAQTVLAGALPPLPPREAITAVVAYLELEVQQDDANGLRIVLPQR
jgi:hypothetical protein